jgi:hypothetical protein
MNISQNEILEALQEAFRRAGPDDDRAVTSTELATALGMGGDRVRQGIKLLIREGVVEPVTTRRLNMTGCYQRVYGYRWIEKKGA